MTLDFITAFENKSHISAKIFLLVVKALFRKMYSRIRVSTEELYCHNEKSVINSGTVCAGNNSINTSS